jgi:glycosyltransferase involved in cell wall biosynthesis
VSNPIRVLHIIKSLGRGGAETLLPETLKLHNQRDFTFYYIYFLPWKDQMVKAIEDQGGNVVCFNANNNIQLLLKAKKIADYVRQHQIQIIHAHLPWAGLLSRLVGKMTGVPVVYTEHNKQERYHFVTRYLNLFTMNWLNRVIAVSGDVANSIKTNKRSLSIPVQTILNGVNTSYFRRDVIAGLEMKTKLGIPQDAPVIGTIAVFRFQKRLDCWMEVTKEILRRIPNCHFILVGDGPLKEELLKKRLALGLEDRIHMPGLQVNVIPYYSSFDIYMMSSVFEGLPIALLEAMSMECAIVSTNAGGIKEVIRDGVDGVSIAVDEWNSLASAAIDLISNIDKLKTVSTAARDRVVNNFSMDTMVNELEKMYREMVA